MSGLGRSQSGGNTGLEQIEPLLERLLVIYDDFGLSIRHRAHMQYSMSPFQKDAVTWRYGEKKS